MADQVRLKSLTVFASDRITIFAEGASEGTKGGAVVSGQEFETDILHARDLVRLGSAEPINSADLNGDVGPLEAHYSVSAADWKRYQAADDAAARQIEAIRERVNQVAAECEAEVSRVRASVEDARVKADEEIAGFRSRVELEREAADSQIAEFKSLVEAAKASADAATAPADAPGEPSSEGAPAETAEPAETAAPASRSSRSRS